MSARNAATAERSPAPGRQPKFRLIPPAEQKRNENGTIAFEGAPYGGQVSVFLVNARPGEGPDLHFHPYSEMWIVRGGKAALNVDGDMVTANAGDIIVLRPEIPHGFKCIGPENLDIVCVHASDHFIQTWVDA